MSERLSASCPCAPVVELSACNLNYSAPFAAQMRERLNPTVVIRQRVPPNPFMIKSRRLLSYRNPHVNRRTHSTDLPSLLNFFWPPGPTLAAQTPIAVKRRQNSPQPVTQSRRERKHGENNAAFTSPIRTKTIPASVRASAQPLRKLEADRGDAVSSDEARRIVATLPGLSTPLERLWQTEVDVWGKQTPTIRFRSRINTSCRIVRPRSSR